MNKKLKAKKVVLALGESTNTHILSCEKEVEYEQEGLNIDMLLKDTGVITHEEHDTILLPPGDYSKVNQMEFNPLDQTLNAVFD